jgi:hypothetical protein
MLAAMQCGNLPVVQSTPAPGAARPAARRRSVILAIVCDFCDKGDPSPGRRLEERCGNGGNSRSAPAWIAAASGDDDTERRPP